MGASISYFISRCPFIIKMIKTERGSSRQNKLNEEDNRILPTQIHKIDLANL